MNSRIFSIAKKTFNLLCILSFAIVLALVVLIINKDKGQIIQAEYNFRSSYLTKFAALVERETYYKTWIDKIIAPGITDDKEKIEKIFEWVRAFPALKDVQEKFRGEFNFINTEQHEYYTLIKQYGDLNDKGRVFCNLMVIAGYPASQIYKDGLGKVIIRIGPRKFLYFDLADGERNPDKIFKSDEDRKKCEDELEQSSNIRKKIINNKYLWADLNVGRYTFVYYLQKMLSQKPERSQFLIESR